VVPSALLNFLNIKKKMKNFFFSPLEQFLIIPVAKIYFFNLIISNQLIFLIINFFLIFGLTFLFNDLKKKEIQKASLSIHWLKSFTENILNFKPLTSLLLVPNYIQIFFELIVKAIFSVLTDNVKYEKVEQFFPCVLTLFLLLLTLNLTGLIPYTFTVTSHLIITFVLSLILFIGINIISINIHGKKIFGLFLPSGIGVGLSFLLVPIELISYIFKPLSLSIRLFGNMMAGHALLKVIAGFGWTLAKSNSIILFSLHVFPLLILVPLFLLETGVAVVQAFVFTVLFCIFLNDALNLH